tara:strand:- start:652 stop:2340 length:1689 start_codon:yes stop_codon:yes gene_type:complete
MLQKINNTVILYSLSLLYLISFHFIIRDNLFFLTKIQYIFYYIFFTGFLFLIFFSIFFKIFIKNKIFLIGYLKFVLFILSLNFFRSLYFFLGNKINPNPTALSDIVIFVFSILLALLIATKITFRNNLIYKAYSVIKIFSYIIFIILTINFFYLKYFSKNYNLAQSKYPVVLIIIDGLPKKFIKNYSNKKNHINIINDEIKEDYIVQNYFKYITPNTWTCGFSSNLYGVSPKNSLNQIQELKKVLSEKKSSEKKSSEKNFFHELDNLNVTYTWAAGHSCAVPEGSSAAISDYNGYKSILNFSSTMSAYLNKIGLPFHSIINMKDFRGDPVAVHVRGKSFIKKIFDLFADSEDYNFQTHMFNLLKYSKRDFYIIHFNYNHWKYKDLKSFKEPIDILLKEINGFFKKINNDKYFKDFNFIITSDHGFSFKKHDFGYGISHSAEVTEVPFIIIKKKSPKDLKLINFTNMYNPCSFRDFQKSLLAYFKNKKNFFSVNCSNEAKTSLSLPDHSNKEWILSVFDNQNVYRYNIYDKYFDDNNNLQFNNETEENLIKFLKMYNLKVDNF